MLVGALFKKVHSLFEDASCNEISEVLQDTSVCVEVYLINISLFMPVITIVNIVNRFRYIVIHSVYAPCYCRPRMFLVLT